MNIHQIAKAVAAQTGSTVARAELIASLTAAELDMVAPFGPHTSEELVFQTSRKITASATTDRRIRGHK